MNRLLILPVLFVTLVVLLFNLTGREAADLQTRMDAAKKQKCVLANPHGKSGAKALCQPRHGSGNALPTRTRCLAFLQSGIESSRHHGAQMTKARFLRAELSQDLADLNRYIGAFLSLQNPEDPSPLGKPDGTEAGDQPSASVRDSLLDIFRKGS